MNMAIIITIIILLLGIKIISSIWKNSLKDTDEYNQLANDPEFRSSQMAKYTSILEKEKNNSGILYKMARICSLDRDYPEAITYLKRYLELEPGDAEGFAELSDYCLKTSQIPEAKAAIEQAITLEPEYAEYRQLQMRMGLQTDDTEYALAASKAWEELDAERVRLDRRPHRWSPMYQIGPKHQLPDAAIKCYHAALILHKDGEEAAHKIIKDMDEAELECLEILLEEDDLFAGVKDIYEEA